MFGLFGKTGGKKFTPLNLITISEKALIHNYHELSSLNPEIKVAPVLKSNAYGHGIKITGEILDKAGAPFLCVDSLYEAFQLKSKAKVKTPILIMGYIHPESLKVKQLPFSFAVYDLDHVKVLSKHQSRARIHIFVDTGMHREGISMENLEEFLEKLKKLENIEVEGLMSHLAQAGSPNSDLTKMQLENFSKARKLILKKGFKPKWFHIGGTYGLLNNLAAGCNLVRVGRAVYGIEEKGVAGINLKPTLKLTTSLVQIKKVKKDEKIGYSGTYIAPKNMQIGILPLGYNDGVDRRLSDKGVVLINGVKCPMVGLVSMNLTTVDITKVKKPILGQEVVVFSDNEDDPNSLLKACKAGGVLPHEMLIHIAESTKRIVV